MKKDRPLVGTGVFVMKDGKFLLGKRKSSFGEGKWCLPGGHLEFGETFVECGKRETYEEAGILIKDVEFLGISNDITENKHYVTIFLKSNHDSGEPILTEFDEFYEWNWVDLESLPDNLFDIFKNFLENNKSIVKQLCKK